MNPNRHPPEQIVALAEAIRRFGWQQPLVIVRGILRIGHGRLEAAQRLMTEQLPPEVDARVRPGYVPVVVDDSLTDEQARALMLVDNKTASMSEFERETLAAATAGLTLDDLPGFTEGELDDLRPDGGSGTGDDETAPPPPAVPVTRVGDVWVLGRHRLACGDATDPTAVARALAGARPALMITDPPYGVSYDPGWRNDAAVVSRRVGGESKTGTSANDDRADWRGAWALFPGDVAYVWAASLSLPAVMASLDGFEVRALIIWRKENAVISRGHYHWQHEPCLYAVREGATANWIGDRKQTTVWDILTAQGWGGSREDTTPHANQKPLECMMRPMRNHDGAVFDPFIGSGSTIIAAEREDRSCYAVELMPGYCDVTVERWEKETGGKAKREGA